MKKNIVTIENLKAVNEVLMRLNHMRRWTDMMSDPRFNELAKQALNWIITYFLSCYYEQENGALNWERFPKIALHRSFQKAFVNYNTPENIIDEILALSDETGLDRKMFRLLTSNKIAEETTSEFSQFLTEGLGSMELELFQNASKIATLIELDSNIEKMGHELYAKKRSQILEEIDFKLPGVKAFLDEEEGEPTKLYKVVKEISCLRNQNRWAAHAYVVDCSVLGHLFDTAIFAWLMSLEENPENEHLASKMFFMGIFHDVAETWTTDIPSDIKDRISGFRELTERYEEKMLEKHFFNRLPEVLKQPLHAVMFEEPQNKCYFKLVKGADYLSADAECFRQYHAGTRDDYFLGAIERRLPGIEEGKVLLTPECAKLFKYYKEYASCCVM